MKDMYNPTKLELLIYIIKEDGKCPNTLGCFDCPFGEYYCYKNLTSYRNYTESCVYRLKMANILIREYKLERIL